MGRTLLSAAFDFDFGRKDRTNHKTKFKGGGQERLPYTTRITFRILCQALCW